MCPSSDTDDAPKKKRAPAKRKPKAKTEGDAGKAPRKRAPRKKAAPKSDEAVPKKAPAKKKPAAKRKAAPKKAAPKQPAVEPAAPPPEPAKPKPVRKAKPAAAKPATPKPSQPAKRVLRFTRKPKVPRPKPPWPERIRNWIRNTATALVVLASLCVVRVASMVYVDPGRTPLMYIRYWEGVGEGHIEHEWRDGADISPNLLLAIVAAEDQKFFDHWGLDVGELQNAIETAGDGGKLRGASTLSQQTAKNVFLWPSRSYLRKGLELCFTLAVEVCWSKQRILEIYANVAEFGPGVYGAEAAAQRYFHKAAIDLTPEEGALLAACLPNPLDRSPADPSETVLNKQAWILQQMQNLGGTAFIPAYERKDADKDKG